VSDPLEPPDPPCSGNVLHAVPRRSRNGFHAEAAEVRGGAEKLQQQPIDAEHAEGPCEGAERGAAISPPDPQRL